MKPALIIAAIAGGASGVFTLQLFSAGLVAAPSPGSIFAVLAMTPKGGYVGIILGVLIAAAVSFLIAAFILKTSKDTEEDALEAATEKASFLKGKESRAAELLGQSTMKFTGKIESIIFACDAGMGSSAMGASILRKKIKEANLDVNVKNTSISNLPENADIVITHKDLTARAKEKLPNAHHISVDNFLNSPAYDELIEKLKENLTKTQPIKI